MSEKIKTPVEVIAELLGIDTGMLQRAIDQPLVTASFADFMLRNLTSMSTKTAVAAIENYHNQFPKINLKEVELIVQELAVKTSHGPHEYAEFLRKARLRIGYTSKDVEETEEEYIARNK